MLWLNICFLLGPMASCRLVFVSLDVNNLQRVAPIPSSHRPPTTARSLCLATLLVNTKTTYAKQFVRYLLFRCSFLFIANLCISGLQLFLQFVYDAALIR